VTIPLIRKQTPRYARKNEAVLEAAAILFNEQGLKGVTLADVAQRVGLNTTSVTYYFSRKDDLAAACVLRSIRAIDAIVTKAQGQDTLAGRISAFVLGYVQLLAEIAGKTHPELINFHDMRALTGSGAAVVFTAYEDLFRRVRALLRGEEGLLLARAEENARTYLLLALTTDAQSWVGRYEPDDYGRTARVMTDVLLGGLAAPGARWAPGKLIVGNDRVTSDPLGVAHDAFLRAATALVNEQGYHGVSVEKISARLNVTKGSFYHHNDSKEELLRNCFERSFAVVRSAHRAAATMPATGWERLCMWADYLVNYQLSDDGPLLRYRALNAVTQQERSQLLAAKQRLSERLAGMIFDGIADGSVRSLDPSIAAQMVDGMINASANLKRWVAAASDRNVSELFARPLFEGLLASHASRPDA
jgi:AcrR family transcriptional regulator